MMSYITPSVDVVTTFAEYTSGVAAMLRSIGLDATADTSRNDIMISGRKVSGNAFYHLPGRSIVHGTMLYDADLATMTGAITPSRAKLQSKGVKSVESRITTVREHSPIGLEDFKRAVRESLCGDRTLVLTETDVAGIEAMEQEYYAPEWLFRRRGRRDAGRRIEGVGEIRPGIITGADGLIERVELSGDFFTLTDPETALLGCLTGIKPSPDAIAAALEGADAAACIPGLTAAELTAILCGSLPESPVSESE